MNDPSERITLALKPKAVPAGAPKPASSASLPSGLDHAVFEELKLATQTYDYLSRFGEPVEFWEAVRLARSRRGVTVGADGEADPSAGEGLAEELQVIRRQLSPMVRDLRRYLTKVPDIPAKGEPLEVALGFLLASSREHQAVAKWLAESDKHLNKAASKLRSLYEIASPYLEILRPWTLDGVRAPLGAKPAAPTAPGAPAPAAAAAAAPSSPAVPAAAPAVAPLPPEQLETFRRALYARSLFEEMELQAAFWEILMINTAERIPCQTRLEVIAQAKRDKQLAVVHEEARNLHARLLPLRARHTRWVDATSTYLKSLPGMPKDSPVYELALGLLVVEPGCTDRAKRWLTDPKGSAKEALDYIGNLGRQAKASAAALKQAAP